VINAYGIPDENFKNDEFFRFLKLVVSIITPAKMVNPAKSCMLVRVSLKKMKEKITVKITDDWAMGETTLISALFNALKRVIKGR